LPPPHAPKNLRQTPGPRHLPFDFLNDGADIEQFFVGARVVNGNLCFVRRDKAGCRSVIKRFSVKLHQLCLLSAAPCSFLHGG
jgi:hypothetical protein